MDDELEAGYREMAKDEDAEMEAADWADALIGDSAPSDPSHPRASLGDRHTSST
jgi:hypothetical protein